jgi:hypothetical protein
VSDGNIYIYIYYFGTVIIIIIIIIIFFVTAAQCGLWPPRVTRFLDQTQRRATVGRTLPDE